MDQRPNVRAKIIKLLEGNIKEKLMTFDLAMISWI